MEWLDQGEAEDNASQPRAPYDSWLPRPDVVGWSEERMGACFCIAWTCIKKRSSKPEWQFILSRSASSRDLTSRRNSPHFPTCFTLRSGLDCYIQANLNGFRVVLRFTFHSAIWHTRPEIYQSHSEVLQRGPTGLMGVSCTNALHYDDARGRWYGQVHRVPAWHVFQTRATDSSKRLSTNMLISSRVSVIAHPSFKSLSLFFWEHLFRLFSNEMSFCEPFLKTHIPSPGCSFLMKYEGAVRRSGTGRDGRGRVPDPSCEFCHWADRLAAQKNRKKSYFPHPLIPRPSVGFFYVLLSYVCFFFLSMFSFFSMLSFKCSMQK